jgi:ribosomal protein S19E (S16A)
VTPSGRKLMDGFAHDILLEIAKTNPQMMKYARVK